jgi:hypothetical protein
VSGPPGGRIKQVGNFSTLGALLRSIIYFALCFMSQSWLWYRNNFIILFSAFLYTTEIFMPKNMQVVPTAFQKKKKTNFYI